MISFDEAYKLTMESISPLGVETVELIQSVNRVPGEDLQASVWSPTLDVSLKDGYAVRSEDVKDAGPDKHVTLNLVGRIAAGGDWTGKIGPGQTVRILSGAPVPEGAQAVLAEEFAVEKYNIKYNPGQLLVSHPHQDHIQEAEKVNKSSSFNFGLVTLPHDKDVDGQENEKLDFSRIENEDNKEIISEYKKLHGERNHQNPSPQYHQYQFRVRRRRSNPADDGPARHLRVIGLRVHLRLPGTIPRVKGHGHTFHRGPWVHPL